jgi:hypothetical protein
MLQTNLCIINSPNIMLLFILIDKTFIINSPIVMGKDMILTITILVETRSTDQVEADA